MKLSYKVIGLTALALPSLVHAAKSNDEQMLSLAPETRIEQRCNARAMGALGREHPNFKPDELVAYAFADPVIRGHSIAAAGAAVRSRGAWYHFAYRCETSDDGLKIKTFEYTLGTFVPRQEWDKHYLVP
ncbi:DUF930 domain-containing protein [Bradyrhizobium sp. STM 3562]|uniref:DUF930 domain-containing protein n=1 Tax=Bradyrhizobium sp. STM 3562 TaxID=578924 RepID=UPI00388E9104